MTNIENHIIYTEIVNISYPIPRNINENYDDIIELS